MKTKFNKIGSRFILISISVESGTIFYKFQSLKLNNKNLKMKFCS